MHMAHLSVGSGHLASGVRVMTRTVVMRAVGRQGHRQRLSPRDVHQSNDLVYASSKSERFHTNVHGRLVVVCQFAGVLRSKVYADVMQHARIQTATPQGRVACMHCCSHLCGRPPYSLRSPRQNSSGLQQRKHHG